MAVQTRTPHWAWRLVQTDRYQPWLSEHARSKITCRFASQATKAAKERSPEASLFLTGRLCRLLADAQGTDPLTTESERCILQLPAEAKFHAQSALQVLGFGKLELVQEFRLLTSLKGTQFPKAFGYRSSAGPVLPSS